MTAAGIARAQHLAGSERCRRILGDADEAAWLDFVHWFLPAAHAAAGDPVGLLAEAMRGWLRLTGSARRMAWFADRFGRDAVGLAARGLVGVARADFVAGGFWTPETAGPGMPVVLIPVCSPGLVEGPRVTRPADCLELVAVEIGAADGEPPRWARRRHSAGILGPGRGFDGERDYEPVWRGGGGWPNRLRLYRDPMSWLRGGAPPASACVLDWDVFEAEWLAELIDAGRVAAVCDDDAHAAELRARVRPRRAKIALEVAA